MRWLRDVARLDLPVDDLPWVLRFAAARLLDAMGVPADARDYAALEDTGRYDRLAGSGFRLAPPTPIFPRLELPAED